MNLESKGFIHNEFDIEVRDSRTGEIKQTAKAYNIVLDAMFTCLLNRTGYFGYIAFGDGTGAQDKIRTSLFNFVGMKGAVQVETIKKAAPLASYVKRKITLLPSEFIGKVLTEVGIASAGTAASMVTHALIKDSEGNPISITKLDTDVITIYATVYARVLGFDASVGIVNFPSANALLSFMLSETSLAIPKIYVGSESSSIDTKVDSHVNIQLGSYKTPTLTKDSANKALVSSVVRFETTESNGPISEIGLEGVARISLKGSTVWPGKPYTNKSLGQGDGVTKYFHLPQGSERVSSIKVYNNSVLVDPSEYKIMSAPYLRDGWIQSPYQAYSHMPMDSYFSEDGQTYVEYDGYTYPYGPQLVAQTIKKTKIIVPASNSFRDISNGSDYPQGADIAYNKDKSIINISTNISGAVTGLFVWNVNVDYTLTSWGPTTLIASPAGLDRRQVMNAAPWSKDDKFVVMPLGVTAPYIKVYNFDGTNKVFGAQVIGQPTFPIGINSIKFSKDFSKIIIIKDASPYIEIRSFDSVTGLIGENVAQINSIPEVKPTRIRLSKTDTLIGFDFIGLYGPMICSIDFATGVIGTKYTISGGAKSIVSFDFAPDETYIVASESTKAYIYLIDKDDRILLDPRLIDVTPTGSIGLITHHPVNNAFIAGFKYSYGSAYYVMYMAIIESMKRTIKFNTIPASGAVLTTDYIIDYIPKSENYVLDLSYTISFAEDVSQ